MQFPNHLFEASSDFSPLYWPEAPPIGRLHDDQREAVSDKSELRNIRRKVEDGSASVPSAASSSGTSASTIEDVGDGHSTKALAKSALQQVSSNAATAANCMPMSPQEESISKLATKYQQDIETLENQIQRHQNRISKGHQKATQKLDDLEQIKSAKEGIKETQFHLAKLYDEGKYHFGFTDAERADKAATIYELVDTPRAMGQLGMMYLKDKCNHHSNSGECYAKGWTLLNDAALEGDGEAQLNLGKIYECGHPILGSMSVEERRTQVGVWYKKATFASHVSEEASCRWATMLVKKVLIKENILQQDRAGNIIENKTVLERTAKVKESVSQTQVNDLEKAETILAKELNQYRSPEAAVALATMLNLGLSGNHLSLKDKMNKIVSLCKLAGTDRSAYGGYEGDIRAQIQLARMYEENTFDTNITHQERDAQAAYWRELAKTTLIKYHNMSDIEASQRIADRSYLPLGLKTFGPMSNNG